MNKLKLSSLMPAYETEKEDIDDIWHAFGGSTSQITFLYIHVPANISVIVQAQKFNQ